jgi:DNA replication protein DnaC
MQFCLDMASPHVAPYWLSLLGKSGVGKTMLARRIVRFFRARCENLTDETKAGQWMRRGGFKPWGAVVSDMVEGDYTGLRDLKDDWFVCLDDIGAEYDRHKELSVAKLYDVLSARTNRFTVITANLTMDEVNRKMDARIASRLLRHGSVVVDIDAPDFNL